MSKLQKQPSETDTFTVDFTSLLESSETLSSIDSLTVAPSGPTLSSQVINSSEITDSDGNTIAVGKAVQFQVSGGTDGYEYLITVKVTTSDGNSKETEVVLLVIDSSGDVFQYYGAVAYGDNYFKSVVHSSAWDSATNPEKRAALQEATRLIDNLNFNGDKASSSQELQFPRDTDTVVPKPIKNATYEIAKELLAGWDPELEMRNLAVETHKYASVSTTYNREFVLEYLRAGIPSGKAWNLLKPYLRQGSVVHLRRIN